VTGSTAYGPGYTMLAEADGSTQLYRFSTASTNVQVLDTSTVGAGAVGSTTAMRLECTVGAGGTVTVTGYVDGEQVVRAVDRSGRVEDFSWFGMVGRSFGGPQTWWVDDFLAEDIS